MKNAVKKALSIAKSSVARLQHERDELPKRDKKIARELAEWQKVIDGLSSILEDATDELPEGVYIPTDEYSVGMPPFSLNFTDGIRYVMEGARRVTAPEIRDHLVRLGFNFSQYKQQLVPVHNALKRLEEQGEVRRTETADSRVAWDWISPLERAKKEMREIEERKRMHPQQKQRERDGK